jgi:AGZA family xanthine/uracil permease-like MFS transporter
MPDATTLLFVNGTLMRGLELHENLSGATFVKAARTASKYRLYSIGDRHPGMYRADDGNGVAVDGELFALPAPVLHRVVAGEPPGLYVDGVELDDGSWVPGVLFRRELLDQFCLDISQYGGWRQYTGVKLQKGRPDQPRRREAQP